MEFLRQAIERASDNPRAVMRVKPTAAERVAQALEILAQVSNDADCAATLRDDAEQVRFDLLEAWREFRAERTAQSAERLRAALAVVVSVYDRWLRLPESDPLVGFRPIRHNGSAGSEA